MGKSQSLSRYVDFLLCSSPLGLKLSPFFDMSANLHPPALSFQDNIQTFQHSQLNNGDK